MAFGMGMWGIADLGWTYYEVFLHVEPPQGSMIRFLFDSHGMFFVMAIFLNQEKTDARVELEEALDFVQIGILFFLIYFGMYFLPAMNLGGRDALAREMTVAGWTDAGIILLAASCLSGCFSKPQYVVVSLGGWLGTVRLVRISL